MAGLFVQILILPDILSTISLNPTSGLNGQIVDITTSNLPPTVTNIFFDANDNGIQDDPALEFDAILLAPNGETKVGITYHAKDNKSGLGQVSFILRDPQGIQHNFYHYHKNFHSLFF